jgi:hypothetical protein
MGSAGSNGDAPVVEHVLAVWIGRPRHVLPPGHGGQANGALAGNEPLPAAFLVGVLRMSRRGDADPGPGRRRPVPKGRGQVGRLRPECRSFAPSSLFFVIVQSSRESLSSSFHIERPTRFFCISFNVVVHHECEDGVVVGVDVVAVIPVCRRRDGMLAVVFSGPQHVRLVELLRTNDDPRAGNGWNRIMIYSATYDVELCTDECAVL